MEGRVVDRVPNYHVEGWVADLVPSDRRRLWLNVIEVLAKLHYINWRDGFEFLDDTVDGRPKFERYLDWEHKWYEREREDRSMPLADAALEWLLENCPAETDVSILWGDPAPANTLFADDLSLAAIIAFEMMVLGPGEIDLAWWFMVGDLYSTAIGIPRLEGLPTRDEMTGLYETIRGRPVRDMAFFEIFAWFRAYIVFVKFGDRMISEGTIPAGTDHITNNPAATIIAKTLGLEVPSLSGGPDLMG